MFHTRTDLAKHLRAQDKIAFNVRNNYVVCVKLLLLPPCVRLFRLSRRKALRGWRHGHLNGLAHTSAPGKAAVMVYVSHASLCLMFLQLCIFKPNLFI
jgi:hypothetical protein